MFGSASPAHSGASATQEGQALVKGVSENNKRHDAAHTKFSETIWGAKSTPVPSEEKPLPQDRLSHS
jgi:hypothetical protein